MLDVIIALFAGAAVVAGLAIMAGPATVRWFRALRRLGGRVASAIKTAPEPSLDLHVGPLHPTAQEVMRQASELASALEAGGHRDLAQVFARGSGQLVFDEAAGLRILHGACVRLRRVTLARQPVNRRLVDAAEELERLVADRSEQLEILPYR